MKKIFMMLSAIVFWAMPCSQMFAASVPIPLGAGYGDVTEGQEGPQRGPVIVPELSIEGYELEFVTPCIGFTLPQGVEVILDAPEVVIGNGFCCPSGSILEIRQEGCEL